MTTLDELVIDAAADLLDPAYATWSAADIERWLVDAIHDYSQWFTRLARTTIITQAGRTLYPLPEDLISVTAVSLAGQIVDPISFPRPDGVSAGWALVGGELYLQPAPVDEQILEIVYTARHVAPQGVRWREALYTSAMPGTAVLVGDGLYFAVSDGGGGDGGIFRSTDGVEWVGVPQVSGFRAFCIARNGNIVCIGASISGVALLVRSTDGGLTGSPVLPGALTAVRGIANAGAVFVAAGADTIVRSASDGASGSWSTIVSGLTNASLVVSDGGNVFIVTDGADYRRSNDAGATFAAPVTMAAEITALATDAAGNWLLAIGGGAVYVSTNNGATFALVALLPTTVTALAAAGGGDWLAGLVDGRVYLSADDGATWGYSATFAAAVTAAGWDGDGESWYVALDGDSPMLVASVDDSAVTVPTHHHSILRAYVLWQATGQRQSRQEATPTSNSSLLMSQLAVNADRRMRAYFRRLATAVETRPSVTGYVEWGIHEAPKTPFRR